MKRLTLLLVLSFSVGSAGLLSSCNEKPKTEEKTETSATPTASTAASDTSSTNTKPDTTSTTATPAPATSKGQKFGYINSAEVLQLMPEAKRADANLNGFVRNLEKQFAGMQTDYQKRVTQFQQEENTMVDAVKQVRIKAITDLEQKMQQSQVSAQQQIAAKREQLFKPILDKADAAIKAVGKENSYDYIFDTTTGTLLYADDAHNILPLVKAKLGIK